MFVLEAVTLTVTAVLKLLCPGLSNVQVEPGSPPPKKKKAKGASEEIAQGSKRWSVG